MSINTTIIPYTKKTVIDINFMDRLNFFTIAILLHGRICPDEYQKFLKTKQERLSQYSSDESKLCVGLTFLTIGFFSAGY